MYHSILDNASFSQEVSEKIAIALQIDESRMDEIKEVVSGCLSVKGIAALIEDGLGEYSPKIEKVLQEIDWATIPKDEAPVAAKKKAAPKQSKVKPKKVEFNITVTKKGDDSLTVAQIKKALKESKIVFDPKMKKAELLSLLVGQPAKKESSEIYVVVWGHFDDPDEPDAAAFKKYSDAAKFVKKIVKDVDTTGEHKNFKVGKETDAESRWDENLNGHFIELKKTKLN